MKICLKKKTKQNIKQSKPKKTKTKRPKQKERKKVSCIEPQTINM